MAILNFPDNPQTDDQYTGDNGTTYTYDGVKWVGRAASGAAGTNSIQNGSFTVQVDVDGDLVLPVGSIIKDAEGNPIGGSGSSDRLTSGQTEFILNIDGSITFPTLSTINWEDGTLTGPTLQMGNDPTSQVIITGPAPNSDNVSAQRFVIQGQQGYGGENNTKGEGGDVYIWAGSGGDSGAIDPRGNGGDVKLRAGLGGNEGGYIRIESGDAEADTGTGGFLDLNAGNGGPIGGTGGNVNIRAGGGNANGGNVNIDAGQGDNNDGGNVYINAGYGAVTSGEVLIETSNGSWYFRNTGELQLPSNGTLKQNNSWTRSTSPTINSISAIVWTSNVNYISGAKLTIQVEANEVGDATGWHSQVCEAVIASRGYANSAGGPLGDPVMTVYGVTHTSTVPLVTFTVQRNPTTKNIEVIGTMTAAATAADLRIYSVETSTRD